MLEVINHLQSFRHRPLDIQGGGGGGGGCIELKEILWKKKKLLSSMKKIIGLRPDGPAYQKKGS